jgi:circadian clock protein KaiC
MPSRSDPARLSTGVPGLDDVLRGGLPAGSMFLIEGAPGAGKTTLGLQFIVAGQAQKQRSLYVLLTESARELESVAHSHGWSLDGVNLHVVPHGTPSEKQSYTVFHPAEAELEAVAESLFEAIRRVRPDRVVIDSLSELRYLAQDSLRYRRLLLRLKEQLIEQGSTALLLDYQEGGAPDHQLETVSHGVIRLDQLAPEYGNERRRLLVRKMRGVEYRNGFHDLAIHRGGLVVFPHLTAGEHHASFAPATVSLGVPAFDALLQGGLDAGTSTLVIGPAGVGKSSLVGHYAFSAAERNEKTALFLFDEVMETFLARSEGLGVGLRQHLAAGRVLIHQLDPASVSPGEFVQQVRDAVERDGVRMIVIDSLNGYRSAMPQEHFLSVQLHELLTYLNQKGITTLLVMSQHGVLGESVEAPIDLSYLADTVILMRYFEAFGSVRQAVSVVKKRKGPHERAICEYFLGPKGVRIGNTISEFQGVLSGKLVFTGTKGALLRAPGEGSDIR